MKACLTYRDGEEFGRVDDDLNQLAKALFCVMVKCCFSKEKKFGKANTLPCPLSRVWFCCLFVCLRSEAVNSSGILSIRMFPKELTEWILRIALIYTFMRVTLMRITLVLPSMRITFVRSAAQKARLFRFQTHSHLYCTESQIQTY